MNHFQLGNRVIFRSIEKWENLNTIIEQVITHIYVPELGKILDLVCILPPTNQHAGNLCSRSSSKGWRTGYWTQLKFTKSYEIRSSVSFLAKFFKIEISVHLDADEKLNLFHHSAYFC